MSFLKYLFRFLAVMLSAECLASKVTLMVEDFPPYIKRFEPGKGVITELVVEAFARTTITAEVKYDSWPAVEDALDNQRVLSFMWLKTKARVKDWHFSQPMYLQKKIFVARASFSSDIQYLHHLHGHKITLVDGVDYGNQIESIRSRLKISEAVSDYAALELLLQGKTELIAADPVIVVDLLSHYYPAQAKAQLKFIETPHFKATPYYLVCGKNYGNCSGYIKKFNHGLSLMNDDGSMTKLLKKAESLEQ